MSTRHRGQRAGLSREAVVETAIRIADADGIDMLTMRRLATELGVMPNALYSYFEDKEALLDELLDRLLGTIPLADQPSRDWRQGLVELMDDSRRLLLAHPQLVSMFLARPGRGTNAARLGERTFALLRRGGLEGERAVEAFRILLIYTLGFAAFQAPRQQADAASRTELAQAAFGALPADEFPQMRRVAEHLAQHPTEENFRTGLRWLLDGIAG